MLNRLTRGLAVTVLGLALPLVAPFAAEGGPPDRTLNVLNSTLDNSCRAAITWDPLQGGKPMYVNVILKYATANGYTTVLANGASEYHRVKQNAGLLEVDFGALAAAQGAAHYRIEVNFVDIKDQAMSGVFYAESDCSAA